jgi:4'-phosphopantetheinyl transferase
VEPEIITHDRIGELHWTRIPSPLPPSFRESCLALLTDEESARFRRFSHIPSAEMYLAARWFSKTLLSGLIRRPPESIRFSYGEGGKPYLSDEEHLFFNVSHSAGVIAFISSDKGETGVDVEEVKDRDCLNLARHFFSRREIGELEKRTDPRERDELFFRIWTQKEAYLKGTGKGLPGGLKHYTVPCVSRESELDGFLIESFHSFPGIMGAYAFSSS